MCDCAALRALALRPGNISTTGLPARAAPDRGEERLRPPDLLGVDHDHAGRAVVGQEFDEVGGIQAGLVAGRDDVGQRHAAAVGGALEMAEHAAALADEGDAVVDAAQRLAREQHVQHHAVDVVGDAEAVRADDREPGVARGLGDLVLRLLSPTSAKPAANTIAEPTLRFAQAAIASRTAAAGSVNTARSTPSGNSSALFSTGRPSIGSSLRPTRWMSPLKFVELQALQDDLAGAAGARRYADDRDRARAQELRDGLRAAAPSAPLICSPCPAATSADVRRCRADASTA